MLLIHGWPDDASTWDEVALALKANGGFRHAAIQYFDEHDAVFELHPQLRANAETQPIVDTSVDWTTEDSQYRTVATITLPRQAAYGPERVRYFDEVMIFRPAHSLEAHRPLGGVMRARLQVYPASSTLRQSTTVSLRRTSGMSEIFQVDTRRTEWHRKRFELHHKTVGQ